MQIEQLCKQAFDVKYELAKIDTNTKNKILREAADQLITDSDDILKENKIDMQHGCDKNSVLKDRV